MTSTNFVPITLDVMKDGLNIASETLKQTLSDIGPDSTKVLLVGLTGSGKTTLLHALVGKRLHGTVDKIGRNLLEVVDGQQLIGKDGKPYLISHKFVSETFTPNVWPGADKTIFLDCPGFYDTDLKKRLVNAFAIDKILEYPGKVKILLVVSEAQLEDRGTGAADAFQMLCDMFPNKDQLKQCLGVVLTKTTEKCTPGKLMLLTGSQVGGDVLSYLVQRTDKIFTFPKVQNMDEYHFDDRDRLLRFLTIDAVDHPQHQVAIDDKTILHSQEATESFNKEKKNVFEEFDKLFENAIKECKTLAELKEWQEYSRSLSEALQQGFKSFCLCGSKLPPFKSICLERLMPLLPWEDFLSDITSNVPSLKRMQEKMDVLMRNRVSVFKTIYDRLGDKIAYVEVTKTMEEERKELEVLKEEGKVTIEQYTKRIEEMNELNRMLENKTKMLEETDKRTRQQVRDMEEKMDQMEEDRKNYEAQVRNKLMKEREYQLNFSNNESQFMQMAQFFAQQTRAMQESNDRAMNQMIEIIKAKQQEPSILSSLSNVFEKVLGIITKI